MFTLQWTEEALESYEELKERAVEKPAGAKKSKPSRAVGLFRQLIKTLTFLQSNPRHPGLRTHEFSSIPNPFDPKQKVFEAYVQNSTPGAYRVFWCYGPNAKDLTIIAITPHP